MREQPIPINLLRQALFSSQSYADGALCPHVAQLLVEQPLGFFKRRGTDSTQKCKRPRHPEFSKNILGLGPSDSALCRPLPETQIHTRGQNERQTDAVLAPPNSPRLHLDPSRHAAFQRAFSLQREGN